MTTDEVAPVRRFPQNHSRGHAETHMTAATQNKGSDWVLDMQNLSFTCTHTYNLRILTIQESFI